MRRGAVLFEVVLAIALFAGAAAFTLSALRSVYSSLERSQKQQEAVDLAKSKMAQLEAGLIPLTDLRNENSLSESELHLKHHWRIVVHTRRTPYTGLTLVELNVREEVEESPVRYTLRQLVDLGSMDGVDE